MEVIWSISWGLNILWQSGCLGAVDGRAEGQQGLKLLRRLRISVAGWVAVLMLVIYLRVCVPGAHIDPRGYVWHDIPLIAGGVWARYLATFRRKIRASEPGWEISAAEDGCRNIRY
jgi:hypothetical protein